MNFRLLTLYLVIADPHYMDLVLPAGTPVTDPVLSLSAAVNRSPLHSGLPTHLMASDEPGASVLTDLRSLSSQPPLCDVPAHHLRSRDVFVPAHPMSASFIGQSVLERGPEGLYIERSCPSALVIGVSRGGFMAGEG